MTLDDLNTSRWMFDPKKADFEERFLERSTIFDFPKDKRKWMIYLGVVYDINSEVRRNIKEYMQRKAIGAEVAGFNMTDDRYDKYIEERLLGEDMDFNRATCEFGFFMFNNDYKLLELLVDKYDLEIKNQRLSTKVLSQKDRQNLQGMKADIEELEAKIFGGEESINMRRALYEGVDNAKNTIPRKEVEMREFEENGLDPWSPFKGYRPNPLIFVGNKKPKE